MAIHLTATVVGLHVQLQHLDVEAAGVVERDLLAGAVAAQVVELGDVVVVQPLLDHTDQRGVELAVDGCQRYLDVRLTLKQGCRRC
ncbi:hypothetical protein D3C84_1124430 [compost metagenome]